MSSPRTVIVSYGTGNLVSVRKALGRLRSDSVISSEPRDIIDAERIILPGVGHFQTAIANLERLHLVEALHEAVLVKKIPILGICLGMELMAKSSEEGTAAGLGWFDAHAVRFSLPDTLRYKVPHMGWNQVTIKKNSELMRTIEESSEFYFAHSYHLQMHDRLDLLNETEYGITFPSAIEKDNIFGVQYHPEKSHDAGGRILENFLDL